MHYLHRIFRFETS